MMRCATDLRPCFMIRFVNCSMIGVVRELFLYVAGMGRVGSPNLWPGEETVSVVSDIEGTVSSVVEGVGESTGRVAESIDGGSGTPADEDELRSIAVLRRAKVLNVRVCGFGEGLLLVIESFMT